MTLILLELIIALPVFSFILTWFIPYKKESWIARSVWLSATFHFILISFLITHWIWKGAESINLKEFVLFKSLGYEFFIDFYFDKVTAVFALVGSFLTLLITIYSSDYLHREKGYKRFFNTIQFFYIGYNLIVFSGNLETLFIGWEILGVSSFILIAFYDDRFLPVKNAIKVFSIYRIGDLGIILAMWLSHHLWHENITFHKLNNFELVHEHLESHSWIGVSISLMILLSACVKSAQLPFSSWLPRAMEGPTPSSAIFYGSLAVHLGVFLLLRTNHFWEQQTSVRILIILVGLSTAIITSSIARAQSSIKGQIAYSSTAQIGIILIEIALGLDIIALIHFASNAFLRSYQLLVSPSMVSYYIREKFYVSNPKSVSWIQYVPKSIAYGFYILSIKEWNLDFLMYKIYWNPLRKISNFLNSNIPNKLIFFTLPMYLFFWFGFSESLIKIDWIHDWLPHIFSCISLWVVFRAFGERRKPLMAWFFVIYYHFWMALSVMYNEQFKIDQLAIYLSGVIVSGLLGIVLLILLQSKDVRFGLDRYRGLNRQYPHYALFFLLACLGLSGFPITPTFVGEDILFTHIHEDQVILACMTSLSYVVEGLAVMRIYARLFMGPSIRTFHEIAYKSS
jgi:NADH:ubiquinone oxidoreductase subunit 5 (subunit L)/multisubunit Na+/H+ antiporter MnhA subunit